MKSKDSLKKLLITSGIMVTAPWPVLFMAAISGASAFIGWIGFIILIMGAILGLVGAFRILNSLVKKQNTTFKAKAAAIALIVFFAANACFMTFLIYIAWVLRGL